MKKLAVLIGLLFIVQAGCVKSVRYSPDEIKDFSPEIQEHIKKGEITTGMTMQQVRYSWGAPSAVNVLKPLEDGKYREEWLYIRTGFFKSRLIFVEGKVTNIVTNEPGVLK